tara:strand:+ start:132 stop:401 length:270 start_codon:yes stop_codon:yes gene_type:complete
MNKLIFSLPYPPPYAGPEVIAKKILEFKVINKRNGIIYINANIRNLYEDKGKFDFVGITIFMKIYFKFFLNLFKSQKEFLYLFSAKLIN